MDAQNQPWFAVVTRQEANARLNNQPQGTFLIRRISQHAGYALSVNFGNQVCHCKINQTAENMYSFSEDRAFGSLQELVDYHKKHKLPISGIGDVLLTAIGDIQ